MIVFIVIGIQLQAMFICELVREYIIILYWGECVLLELFHHWPYSLALAITGQCQAIGVAFLVSI